MKTMMARTARWLNANSPLFSRILGEDFTRKEVIYAAVGYVAFFALLCIVGTLEKGGAL